MNIIVCIKQVPGTNKVEVDPVTGVLKRSGVDSKMNPYDLYALETALRIYNGKALINSVNGKLESMSAVFPLVKKYGGVVMRSRG